MKKRSILVLAGVALLGLQSVRFAEQLRADTKKPDEPLKLKVGQVAPDFTMKTMATGDLKEISLHDYRGKKSVVLAFYVFAFTGG